jgi:hypothetical protein
MAVLIGTTGDIVTKVSNPFEAGPVASLVFLIMMASAAATRSR